MNFVDEIGRRCGSYGLLGHGTLLAVSGGADSVALLLGMIDYAHRQNAVAADCLAVAHFNHGFRGEESDGDARFVRDLAASSGLRYLEERLDSTVLEADTSGSFEAAARAARYAFLVRSAERLGLRYVATAHTADDQIETVLHRILRGTGIAGLAGMPLARRLSDATTLVRPLLSIRKAELLDALQARNAAFRNDSSNADARFTRNRLRNRLLPLLRKEFNPQVDGALLRLADQARENRELVEREALRLLERALQNPNGEGCRTFPNSVPILAEETVLLDRSVLLRESEYLVREMFLLLWRRRNWPLRSMGAREWERLVSFLRQSEQGRERFPGGLRAEIDPDGKLRLASVAKITEVE